MSQPATETPVDRAVREASRTDPLKLLIAGGVGSGKSTVLDAVRRTLRERGMAVLGRPGGDRAAALVVDDAHLLSTPQLQELIDVALDPQRTLVVAAEPRLHNAELRTLFAALDSEGPRIALAPLTIAECGAGVHAATAGIPFLVEAHRAGRPVHTALIERLRGLDHTELDTLLLTSLSGDLGATDIAAALGLDDQRSVTLIDAARASGLAEPSHTAAFQRTVHRAVAQILGNARHHECETALLRGQLESAILSPDLAVRLAEHGLRDDRLAESLRRHARALRGAPADLARVRRAAVDAGAVDLRAALADALALSADCAAAAALSDEMLSTADPSERAAAVRIVAAVAAHDGNATQSAELFGWLGPHPDAVVGAAAVIVHLGCGDIAAARTALATKHAGPPTAVARAAHSMASGLMLTVDGEYAGGANQLGQAAGGEQGGAVSVLPDSAAALTTLAALHSGDVLRARSVIGRAVTGPGDPFVANRHRLLHAWVQMQDAALLTIDDADPPGAALHRRDALWAAALRTALARRGGDAGALQQHWYAGMDVLAEYALDLYSLLPLGEMWIAAARLRQLDRVRPAVDRGFAILHALGDPPAWSLPLHWAGVHAGIIAGDPASVAPHGQALAAAAPRSPFAAALAGAGRTWLRVLAGQVDADEVISAARMLAAFGLTSDATRLAGQAALQAGDAKISGLMLQMARDLKGSTAAPHPEADAEPAGGGRPPTALSDREREVAELLLLGMPYRDIGARLFISAKTVEHHVARIRRRLGASSRPEMLSMLRAVLDPDTLAS